MVETSFARKMSQYGLVSPLCTIRLIPINRFKK